MQDLLEDQLCPPPAPCRLPLSLHVGIEYGVGGVGRIFSELMRCLPEAGFDFAGLVAGPANVAGESAGLVNRFADGESMRIRLLGARRAIATALKAQKPAIVASHFALYTAPALDLLGACPNVTHFHGPWSAESRQESESALNVSLKSVVERAVYRRADRVIVLSQAFAGVAQKSFGVNEDKIRLVPGCVDVDRFSIDASRQQSRALLGLPQDRPILVSVRRLVRRMGLHTLIEALSEICRKVPEVLLCVGGRGPMISELSALVERHDLTRQVRFPRLRARRNASASLPRRRSQHRSFRGARRFRPGGRRGNRRRHAFDGHPGRRSARSRRRALPGSCLHLVHGQQPRRRHYRRPAWKHSASRRGGVPSLYPKQLHRPAHGRTDRRRLSGAVIAPADQRRCGR